MDIYNKLQKCRQEIKSVKLEKEGRNKFSNYNYFTPSQVDKIVSDACFANNVFTQFNLIRTELGLIGKLILIDLDGGKESRESNNIIFEMATDIPEIKATNVSQQIGGAMTYTERSMKMSIFGIVDNNLDFDNHNNNTKNENTKVIWLTDEQFNIALNSGVDGIEATLKVYTSSNGKAMKKEFKAKLEAKLKELKE
jgi:hypothetical protein